MKQIDRTRTPWLWICTVLCVWGCAQVPQESSDSYLSSGHDHHVQGQYDEAIETFKKSIKREPDNIFAHLGLTGTYSYMGREKEAHEAALEVHKIDPEFSLKKFAKTIPSKNQDGLKRYIEALRKAGLK